jgi:hypothetical protein
LEYADRELEKYTEEDLLNCMSNIQQISDVIHNPANMFQGPGGHTLAATMIQKTIEIPYEESINYSKKI